MVSHVSRTALCLGSHTLTYEKVPTAFAHSLRTNRFLAITTTHHTHTTHITTQGVCQYIYFNIFFGDSKPNGRMNQFVPQLMVGESLTTSSGPPDYHPIWVDHKSWVFSSQYVTV